MGLFDNELVPLPSPTDEGIIELVKKLAITEGDNRAVGIVKELIDKKGLPFVSNLIQKGDAENVAKGIASADPDITKRYTTILSDRAQDAIIPTLANRLIPSLDPISSSLDALNLANTGFNLAGGVTENFANLDIPYVDPAFELLNKGVQGAGNIMQKFTDLGNGFYQDTFGRVFNLGQKKVVNPMMSGIRRILNLNDGRVQPDLPIANQSVVQPVVQQPSVIDDYIASLNKPTMADVSGSQTISGGTTNPADDIVVTNLPKPIFRPTMADVAGPSFNNNFTPSRPTMADVAGPSSNNNFTPSRPNTPPPGYSPKRRTEPDLTNRATGGLVSVSRYLKGR